MASPLTWHVAGAGVLLIVLVVLATRFALDWAAISSSSADALSGKQVELKALDMQTAPLRGLDTEELGQTLRKRWGKPRETQDTWIWRAANRVITVDPSAYPTTFVIHASAPATTTALARAVATPAPRS